MPKDGICKWINLVFALIIVGMIIWIFSIKTSTDWGNTKEIVLVALIIILVLFVIVYFVRRYLLSSSCSSSYDRLTLQDMDKDSYVHSSDSVEKQSSVSQVEDDFDTILRLIGEGFNPSPVKDEEDSENQLIRFLNTRFPNRIQTKGHTSTGKKVDIAIDGTYSIELIVANNEGRLVSLMDQILRSKQDFGEVAVILLDVDEVPAHKIEEYVDAYKKAGAKVIVKKASY